ncbi:MAG: septum formation initiator family protein [Actinomycetales bacterium]|nr:septum formation initiator family protein [Actinomycetales bacterium]
MVLLAGFTLLFPTVRAYLAQRAELAALAGQVAAAEQAERDLQRELDRWEDDAYVAAQARERLSYVLPGETAYRVIDPEVVVEEEPEDGPEPADGPTLPDGGAVAPWYATVWDSLAAAGASGPEAEE